MRNDIDAKIVDVDGEKCLAISLKSLKKFLGNNKFMFRMLGLSSDKIDKALNEIETL